MMEQRFVSEFLNKFVSVSVGRCWSPGESQGRGGQEDLDIIIKNQEIYEASIQMD